MISNPGVFYCAADLSSMVYYAYDDDECQQPSKSPPDEIPVAAIDDHLDCQICKEGASRCTLAACEQYKVGKYPSEHYYYFWKFTNISDTDDQYLPQPLVVPALMPPVGASASQLKLAWNDCGDSSTHTKITSFSLSTITTGQKATMAGMGNLDEDVSGATFDLEMNTLAGKVSCKGDASQSKTCHLPLGVGSLTFNAMSFPIKKGSTTVSVDLSLSAMLPGALAHTETKVTATATGGDKLFCMDIKSAPAVAEVIMV